MNERLRRTMILTLAIIMTVTLLEPIGGPEEVQAFVPGGNLVVGVFRLFGAHRRRNRVYEEADATSQNVNAYYDSLVAKTQSIRREMISDVVAGDRSPVMARAYTRIEAVLKAEREAAIRMIEAEKKQARHDFNRTLEKTIVNILIASPGGQQIIRQVREALGRVKEAAVAVQTALNKGKPIDALVEDLAEKVSGIPIVQDAVQHLGSKVGHRIDRALGGAIGRIEGAIENVQAEIGGAIDVVDELDGNVAQYDETDWDVVSYIEESGVINGLVPVDRANAAQDVAASAYSRAAELNGGLEPGISRDTMRGRIKNGLLDQSLERIGGYLGENGAGKVFCTAAGRGEYELASKQLGQTPLVPNDPDTARYICCYDIQTQTPVSARLLGSDEEETAADETAEETTTQSEDAAIVGQGEQIPVGNYTGVSNYPEVLNKMGWFVESEGNLTYHNVTVNVADDGNVSGSYSLYYVGFQQDKFNYFGKVCSGHAEADITGVFEGQLTGSRGIIRSTENWVCPQFYDCQILDVCTTDEPYYREFEIQINGGTMTGVTVPYPEDQDHIFVWTFNAVRE